MRRGTLPELTERDLSSEQVRAASAEELSALLHESDEKALLALIENPNFMEKHAELLLDRAEISAMVVAAVAQAEKGKWMASESVRSKIAQHPHAPKRIALAAMKQMFLFNLVRLSLSPSARPDIRHAAEEAILGRVPHLPVGEKLTLARRGSARVAGAILAEGHPQAMKPALGNSFLTESQVLRVLAKDGVPERVVAAIAAHPKWSRVYNVRMALVRNEHVPTAALKAFVRDVTLRDLKDVSELPGIAESVKLVMRDEIESRSSKIKRLVDEEPSGAA